jgi:hypothetical protein
LGAIDLAEDHVFRRLEQEVTRGPGVSYDVAGKAAFDLLRDVDFVVNAWRVKAVIIIL